MLTRAIALIAILLALDIILLPALVQAVAL